MGRGSDGIRAEGTKGLNIELDTLIRSVTG